MNGCLVVRGASGLSSALTLNASEFLAVTGGLRAVTCTMEMVDCGGCTGGGGGGGVVPHLVTSMSGDANRLSTSSSDDEDGDGELLTGDHILRVDSLAHRSLFASRSSLSSSSSPPPRWLLATSGSLRLLVMLLLLFAAYDVSKVERLSLNFSTRRLIPNFMQSGNGRKY